MLGCFDSPKQALMMQKHKNANTILYILQTIVRMKHWKTILLFKNDTQNDSKNFLFLIDKRFYSFSFQNINTTTSFCITIIISIDVRLMTQLITATSFYFFSLNNKKSNSSVALYKIYKSNIESDFCFQEEEMLTKENRVFVYNYVCVSDCVYVCICFLSCLMVWQHSLIGHQHMIAFVLIIVGRCVRFWCITLAFDFDIVLLAEFINFDAFLCQQFMFGRYQFFQLLFGIVQLRQHFFDGSFAQNATDQTETFAIRIDSFQCVYHCSANKMKRTNTILGLLARFIDGKQRNFQPDGLFRRRLLRLCSNIDIITYLCSFKSNSNVDILFTTFLCSLRNTWRSARILSGFGASVAIADKNLCIYIGIF